MSGGGFRHRKAVKVPGSTSNDMPGISNNIKADLEVQSGAACGRLTLITLAGCRQLCGRPEAFPGRVREAGLALGFRHLSKVSGMPGKTITDHPVHRYRQHRNKLTQVAAAARAEMSERSAPPATGAPGTRPAASGVGQRSGATACQADDRLSAVTLLEALQRRYPGQWATGVLRTLQWRAQFGA